MTALQRVRMILVYALYIIVFSLIQFRWPEGWSAWGVKPDFQLVLTVIAGYMFGLTDGIVVGLCFGLIRDCISARTLGIGMLLLFGCGAIASVLLQKRFSHNLITAFLVTIIITFTSDTLIFLIQLAISRSADYSYWPGSFLLILAKRMLPQVLMNLLAAIPGFLLLSYAGPYARRYQWNQLTHQKGGDSIR